jgi:hypothetical protein
VFKQRCRSTTTAPRYQEDYLLAAEQLRALDAYTRSDNAMLHVLLLGLTLAFVKVFSK